MASASTTALTKSLLVVKLHEACLIQPALPQYPPQTTCFLSNIDQAMAPLTFRALFVFGIHPAHTKLSDNPALMMKQALQKVLVHYYPIAGRLRTCRQGRLIIECNGEGVLFVEADANMELSQLGDLSLPDPSIHGQLISPFPVVEHPPLLTAQVTKFHCGGFVLGLVFNHGVLDGVAAAEFLNAWAETTQGSSLSVPPILDRTFLKAHSPLQIKYPHTEYLEIRNFSVGSESCCDNIVYKSFCFSRSHLKELKKVALEDGKVSKCSSVEALSALVWKARTQAMGMRPEQQVKLIIAMNANVGPRLRSAGSEPVIPKGFVGNGFVCTYAMTTASELEKRALSYAVKQVQEAIARGTEDYMQSQIDYMEREKVGMPPTEATLLIESWCGLRFYAMEMGKWGKPKHAGPVTLLTKETATLHPCGENQKDTNVVLGLPRHAAHKMEELLHPHLCIFPSRL